MSSQALYRKWRSQTFDEVVAQEHVTRTLRNALRDGRIGHAYLFAGPRGTGKTSMARLLAKAVNCVGEAEEKPCNKCHVCEAITEGRALDLIEIDAASNRGIDEVRDLRDKVRFRPNEFRYRVYIMDEVHMLTTPAFNALLKTLEEPPDHAIFVLVTTEPQNIPITILSRCQRFDFHRIPLSAIRAHLSHVAEVEGLQITESAIEVIARHATGAMRDALSLLDQLMAYRAEEITVERVHEVLGTASEGAMTELVDALIEQDMAAGLRAINRALDVGAEPRQYSRDALEYLRALMLLKVGGEAELLNVTADTLLSMRDLAQRLPLRRLLGAIDAFNGAGQSLKDSMHPRLPLEIALVSAVLDAQPDVPSREESSAVAQTQGASVTPVSSNRAPRPANLDTPPRRQAQAVRPKPEPARTGAGAASNQPETASKPAASAGPGDEAPHDVTVTLAWIQENWEPFLQVVRDKNRAVQALLNGSCEPVAVENGTLVLGFYHDFHREQISQPKKLDIVREALAQVSGQNVLVKCVPFRGDVKRVAQKVQAHQEAQKVALSAEDPVVQEMVNRYGAQVTSVRPVEDEHGRQR